MLSTKCLSEMNKFLCTVLDSVFGKMQGIVVFVLFIGTLQGIVAVPTFGNRIVNGHSVLIEEIPYQAALRRKVSGGWTHTCGAIIVAKRAVLTAGHCVLLYEENPSCLQIVVGTSFRLTGGTNYKVKEVIIHEDYSPSEMVNDIALLVLSEYIKFNQLVQPIRIAAEDIYVPDGTAAIVSGYGTIDYEGDASPILLAAHVYTVPQDTCLRAYLRIATISSGMICASAIDPPRDACRGDSGGPLVANGTLIGIVSWGEGCAEKNYPGVYTRVSVYNKWIHKKLAINNEYSYDLDYAVDLDEQ